MAAALTHGLDRLGFARRREPFLAANPLRLSLCNERFIPSRIARVPQGALRLNDAMTARQAHACLVENLTRAPDSLGPLYKSFRSHRQPRGRWDPFMLNRHLDFRFSDPKRHHSFSERVPIRTSRRTA